MRKKTFKVTLTIWFMIDSFPHKQPDTCVNKQQLLCLHNIDWKEISVSRYFLFVTTEQNSCWESIKHNCVEVFALFFHRKVLLSLRSLIRRKKPCAHARPRYPESWARCACAARQPEKSAQIFSRALHLTVESRQLCPYRQLSVGLGTGQTWRLDSWDWFKDWY